MRDSAELDPLDDDESYAWGVDQRDLDHPNQRAFTRIVYRNRIDQIIRIVEEHAPRSGRIADVGCAQGNVSIPLAERGFRVDAFDLNASFLAYGQRKDDTGSVSWHHGNAFELSTGQDLFDAVILGEIVEHVAHPDDLLDRAVGLLRVGGVVVVTTPNGRWLRDPLPSYNQAISTPEGLAQIEREQFGIGGEHHLFAYTIEELREHVPQNAEVVSIGYMGNGLYNSHVQRVLDGRFGLAYDRLAASLQRFPGLRQRLSLTLLMVVRRLS